MLGLKERETGMKVKQMIAIPLLLLGFAGIVQASSMNGDYNGDPIVRVLVGGNELKVEDAPAVIRDGRTMVPLYLLRQTGMSVKWDEEKYSVELTLPTPTPTPTPDASTNLKTLNAKAKEYSARNIKLIHNEYGPYLQVDLEIIYDSTKDNDRIVALSSILTDPSVDVLVVNSTLNTGFYNNKIVKMTVIQRADALAFQNKKLAEYEFIKKWKTSSVDDKTDMSSPPNLPQEPEPVLVLPNPYQDAICRNIIETHQRNITNATENYNRGNNGANGFEQYLKTLKEGMNTALKEANCKVL